MLLAIVVSCSLLWGCEGEVLQYRYRNMLLMLWQYPGNCNLKPTVQLKPGTIGSQFLEGEKEAATCKNCRFTYQHLGMFCTVLLWWINCIHWRMSIIIKYKNMSQYFRYPTVSYNTLKVLHLYCNSVFPKRGTKYSRKIKHPHSKPVTYLTRKNAS